MRIPVFARGANPRVDRPILRKKESYCREQVEVYGRADWVDANDPSKGILCRELIYFGERAVTVETVPLSKLPLPLAELPGLKFLPPKMEQNPTLPRLILPSLPETAAQWA